MGFIGAVGRRQIGFSALGTSLVRRAENHHGKWRDRFRRFSGKLKFVNLSVCLLLGVSFIISSVALLFSKRSATPADVPVSIGKAVDV